MGDSSGHQLVDRPTSHDHVCLQGDVFGWTQSVSTVSYESNSGLNGLIDNIYRGMKFSGTPLTAVEVEVFNRTSRTQDLLEISQALKDGVWTSSTLAETVANSTLNEPYVPVKTTWGDALWLMKTVYFGMPGVRTVFLKAIWYRVLNRL